MDKFLASLCEVGRMTEAASGSSRGDTCDVATAAALGGESLLMRAAVSGAEHGAGVWCTLSECAVVIDTPVPVHRP